MEDELVDFELWACIKRNWTSG